MIFVVKSASNRENNVIESMVEKVEKNNLGIYSIIIPIGLKGYLFLEAENRDAAEQVVFNVRFARGLLTKPLEYKDIERIVKPSVKDVSIDIGDTIEMVGATLKGEKARVLRVDKRKEEVVVSLLGSLVQMELTVKIDDVKVIIRGEDDDN